MAAAKKMKPVSCKVECVFDEIRLYFGEEWVRLTISQADELAELLVNASEHASNYEPDDSKEMETKHGE